MLCRYVENDCNNIQFSFVSIANKQIENLLRHYRLGYVSEINMKYVTGLKCDEILQPGSICPLSKQHRVIFPDSNT